jgi:hypothetical protein
VYFVHRDICKEEMFDRIGRGYKVTCIRISTFLIGVKKLTRYLTVHALSRRCVLIGFCNEEINNTSGKIRM